MTKAFSFTKPTKKPDGTIDIPVTIAKTSINKTYQQVLDAETKKAQIKGFRKGKAPQKLVESSLDKSSLYEKVINQLFPQAFSQAVKEFNLKPISYPKVKLESLKENQDWKFIITLAQFPEFNLGKYKDLVKGALSATKIWLPGQDKTAKPDKQTDAKDNQSLTDKRLKKVFDALLDNIKVPVAQILIEEEVNKTLSRLLQQTQKLGLTVESYLKSIGKTSKQIREEYEKTAKDNLKLEFILQKISQDLNIEITDKEINDMIAAIPDEKTRKSFDTPGQKAYVKSVLRKRKTIDALLKL